MKSHQIARALGWFSIGLGLTEVLAPRQLGRWLGLEKRSTLLRGFGFREIAAGIGILAAGRVTPWLWARVGGDALDLALLGSALKGRRAEKRRHAAIAIGNVAMITALDIACAKQLSSSSAYSIN